MKNVQRASDDPYTVETFKARLDGDHADGRTSKWFEAVFFGFHDGTPAAASLAAFTRSYLADDRTLTGVYAANAPAGSWDPEIPVATYATLAGALNVGGSRMLPSHLITAVTVRGTHRRRGLLRRLITADLAQAKSSGLSMAALTASEATIYGRFGFGAATFTRRVEIETKERFAVTSQQEGTVEVVDRARLLALAPEIFERFHQQTLGSMQRQDSYPFHISGAWTGQTVEEDKSVRAAVHYNDAGAMDGYVSYKFSGWDTEPYTLKVIDLVAATESAYLQLWRYLGSIDLIERIRFSHAGEEDPLPWALADRRGYKAIEEEDVLWLRVLDTAAALTGRQYFRNGSVSLKVDDPLGLAGGVFDLQVSAGQGRVSELGQDDEAAIQLSVNALSSLYLGGVSARTLAAAGQLTARTPEDLERFDTLLSTPQAPYCITHF